MLGSLTAKPINRCFVEDSQVFVREQRKISIFIKKQPCKKTNSYYNIYYWKNDVGELY